MSTSSRSGAKLPPAPIDPELIAPCGMNCAVCIAHLRTRRQCDGCNGDDQTKPKHCVVCRIKNCAGLGSATPQYCFTCDQFPCAQLKHLDRRYRMNYGMSMIDNLRAIKEKGIAEFVKREAVRWTCSRCGARLSAHRGTCLSCGAKRAELNLKGG